MVGSVRTFQEYKNIYNYLKYKRLPITNKRYVLSRFKKKCKNINIIDDKLYVVNNKKKLNKLIVVNKKGIESIIKKEHENGHIGMDKLYLLIQEKYHIISRKNIRSIHGGCEIYLISRPFKNKNKMKSIKASRRLERNK